MAGGHPLVDGRVAGGKAAPPGQGAGGAALIGSALEHGVEDIGLAQDVDGEPVGGPLLGPVPPGQEAADRQLDAERTINATASFVADALPTRSTSRDINRPERTCTTVTAKPRSAKPMVTSSR